MPVGKVFLIIVASNFLAASAVMAIDDHYKQGYTPTKSDVTYITRAQAYVKHHLRDPSKTRFRYLYVKRKKKLGFPIVCGQINTKDTSGNYSGWQRFVATPAGDYYSIEKQLVSWDFKKVWDKVCR